MYYFQLCCTEISMAPGSDDWRGRAHSIVFLSARIQQLRDSSATRSRCGESTGVAAVELSILFER
jgi:hypothetical protein